MLDYEIYASDFLLVPQLPFRPVISTCMHSIRYNDRLSCFLNLWYFLIFPESRLWLRVTAQYVQPEGGTGAI